MAQSANGYSKIKNKLEDTLQAVHTQISQTETAIEALTDDLGDLSAEELAEFKSHPKVRTFVAGLEALKVVLKLQMSNLETAEQMDSQY